jgi:glutamate synthase (NADPH/NADH) small chain
MTERVTRDVSVGLLPQQAAAEAGRCLYCYDAPCVKGCPAGVDVPAFIRKVGSGNWRGAARVIREANVFGGTCALVCPTEELCEKECSSRLLGGPISIGALQRLAWERGTAGGVKAGAGRGAGGDPGEAAPAGKRAAIVGAGPAGLSAAWELRSRGWDVTIYEATDKPGGQLDWTIPSYRLPPEVVAAEVGAIVATGVKLRTGVRVGREAAEGLLAENDAVILATGLGGGRASGAPGEGRPGVVGAEEFLARARGDTGGDLSGQRVVVVGGGNTAMDAAVTAARGRATRVTVLYRRTAREMPAWPREYRGALAAGAEFLWLVQPVAFEGAGKAESAGKVEGGGRGAGAADGPVTGVRCVRMALGAPDASGRAAPRPIPGSEFTIEADLVVMALGQGPNQEIIEAFGLAADKAGRPVIDAAGRASTVGLASGSGRAQVSAGALPAGHVLKATVFVAGDLGNGGATVVRAVAEGKRAARAAAGELPPSTPREEAGSNGR